MYILFFPGINESNRVILTVIWVSSELLSTRPEVFISPFYPTRHLVVNLCSRFGVLVLKKIIRQVPVPMAIRRGLSQVSG